MAVPARIRNQLPALAATIEAYQVAYLAEHGRYWQGIRTHEIAPSLPEAPVKTRKPTDQAQDWSALVLPAVMDMALEVHTYNGPEGKGYVIFGECLVAGEPWRTAINFGPETYRDSDWEVQVSADS